MILKTNEQIKLMRKAGLLVWEAHQVTAPLVQPGTTTAEIDRAVETFLLAHHAVPLFKGVPGEVPFPAATCISVNEEVVHGIPGSRRLRSGDVVSIDIGVNLDEWCGDAAVTYSVGEPTPRVKQLLDTTEGALNLAIQLMGQRQRWSQVGREIANYIHRSGCYVIPQLGGHTIGREMWEGVHVPNFSNREFEKNGDFALEPGVVVAVEPIVSLGTPHIRLMQDHWTIVTQDGSLAAHFEHTIAMTEKGPVVLTAGPGEDET